MEPSIFSSFVEDTLISNLIQFRYTIGIPRSVVFQSLGVEIVLLNIHKNVIMGILWDVKNAMLSQVITV